MPSLRLLLLICSAVFSAMLQAQINDDNDLHIKPIANGFPVPWGMVEIADNQLLITQRMGKLTLLNMSTAESKTISGLPAILVEGQGGLFDVAIAPDYEQSKWLYFSYNKDVDGQGATTLARAKLTDNKLTDWQDILISQSRTENKVHYGGRISFDGKGHVFLSIGDRGERNNAQDRTNHAGSILRLNVDGTIPSDNPFVGQENVLPEIWSYGHRNPQGLFFNRQTTQLWAIEHGPRGGDEINLVQAGRNYGWPVISYGKEYWAPLQVGKGTHQAGMKQPIQVYIPSIAPGSLIQYQGKLFTHWHGKLLAGAMALQHLNVITLDAETNVVDETRLLDTLNSRIRNVIERASGSLLVATDNGTILEVTPVITDNE